MKKMLLYLLVPVLLLCAIYTAKANQIVLGEEVTFQTLICMEEPQLALILDAHQERGVDVARAVARILVQGGACVVAQVTVIAVRVVKTYTDLPLLDGTTVTARNLEVMAPNGQLIYAVVTIPVINRNEKNPI